MNKTAVTLAFIALAILGFAGAILVLIVRPEAAATAIGLVVTILGLASTGIVTFYALGKQGEVLNKQTATIETIQKQTNGTTTALLAENTRLTNLLHAVQPGAPTDIVDALVTTGRHV